MHVIRAGEGKLSYPMFLLSDIGKKSVIENKEFIEVICFFLCLNIPISTSAAGRTRREIEDFLWTETFSEIFI